MMDYIELEDALTKSLSKSLDKLKEILSSQQEEAQSFMTKFPDDRRIIITFKDFRDDVCTYCTTDSFHLYYNKDFVYVQDEENNTMKIIPMRNIDSIDDHPVKYDEDDDLPFTMNDDPDISASFT